MILLYVVGWCLWALGWSVGFNEGAGRYLATDIVMYTKGQMLA